MRCTSCEDDECELCENPNEDWSDRQTVEELTRNEHRAAARAINREELS